MAIIKLYGMPGSTCTRRVQMTLAEKGIDYELVPINLMKGEHKTPEYLANIQPFGVIPAIEHDGLKLFESRAIMRYIASLPGGTEVYGGSDLKARATIENWIEVESAYWNPAVSTIVGERVFKKWRGQETDEAVVAEKIEAWKKALDVYEKRLASQPYLAGQDFTIADITHMPYTAYALTVGGDAVLDAYSNVKAWWGRISSRPTWAKVVAVPLGA